MAAALVIEKRQAYTLVTYTCYFCYLKLSKQVSCHNTPVTTQKVGNTVQKNTAATLRRRHLWFMLSSAKHMETHMEYLCNEKSEHPTI